MDYNDLTVSYSAEKSQKITEQLISDFATVTGDKNPLHLDEAYASKTRFKGRIAHGMIAASLIAALLSEYFPGGTYISQTLIWKSPVRIGDTITTHFTVLEKHDEKRRIGLKTECINQVGELVLTGEARIQIDKK